MLRNSGARGANELRADALEEDDGVKEVYSNAEFINPFSHQDLLPLSANP